MVTVAPTDEERAGRERRQAATQLKIIREELLGPDSKRETDDLTWGDTLDALGIAELFALPLVGLAAVVTWLNRRRRAN